MARTRSHAGDDDRFGTDATAVRLSGVIRKLNREKGFGFLAADGREYFFHRTALDHPNAFEALTEGQSVTFEPAQGPKGLRAERLLLV